MVIGYHLIFTCYGWWLPNDPRGSSSNEIRSDLIAELGALHQGRKRIQPNGPAIRAFYKQAKQVLKHDLRQFDIIARENVACGFAQIIRKRNYTCYGCAIMPDHVHVLMRKHRDKAEQMILQLQEESRECLIRQGSYPLEHPVWGGPGWKVFLDTPDAMHRTIRYINRNPSPCGLPVQEHGFVSSYDGWDLSGAAR